MSRIARRFAELKRAGRSAFVPFVTAGDPDAATSAAILKQLPSSGADLIELGVPFSDPMADGPAIQASSLRALNAGMTVPGVFELVRAFRRSDKDTPIVLMGYFNPIHRYDTSCFVKEAAEAGVDGLIVVDLPPEEDEVLRGPACDRDLDIIRLATPTSHDERLAVILNGASGFLYYVSVSGVTGTKALAEEEVRGAVARVKAKTDLPVAVGFGIKTAEQAQAVAGFADAVVVGSAIVTCIAEGAEAQKSSGAIAQDAIAFCATLAQAIHAAGREGHDMVAP
ncbi:MAG: tryptophan synthase subunit alpha [Alphaproteobacteria bacterium]|nr:tryptophan synthase subunit alpha [Alphaproteobacteria bacterium]MBV9063910.1 tryptophan synthase subunit alpha [Alphaproteobacteria bacterium]